MSEQQNASKEVYSCPMIRSPTSSQVADLAQELGFHMGEEEIKYFHTMIRENIDGMNSLEPLVEPRLPTKYPRLPGYRPEQKDNQYNAWYWRCEIKGANSGKLAGKTIAIKDNVAVAGVPMMNGCHALEGFTPDFDATVVTRILDAGGTIVGKTVCENLCYSGASSTAAKGPVCNPHDKGRSAGGSSSGSAVVVATGEVDLAIGGDQGGSVRLPACWTGLVGLKPTHGLVPYTGAMGMDFAIDHLGPMAKTVRDCALFLEVLAGYDNGMDPRQHPVMTVPAYTKELENGSIEGLKVGMLREGFEMDVADPAVIGLVRETVGKLARCGGIVTDLSLPLHAHSSNIWGSIAEGIHMSMVKLAGVGVGHTGYYPTNLARAGANMYSSRPDDLADTMKLYMIQGEYMHKTYRHQVYCRGRNLAIALRQAYDKALEDVDVLALPTIPYTADELINKDDVLTPEFVRKNHANTLNTMACNLTGHPAISVNAGFIQGLPVGLMLVGKHFDEVTVLKVAQAVEKVRDDDI